MTLMGLPPEIRETTQDVAQGTTRALLSVGKDAIKSLAQKFLNKELVFIEDIETIDLVKQQLKSGEWAILKHYIQDRRLKLLIQMGLTLRILEQENKKPQLENLRGKIVSKYQEAGLHISQFVQCKLLVTYLTRIIDSCKGQKVLADKIKHLLDNLELRVSFIKTNDDASTESSIIFGRLATNLPEDYLIFARDSAFPKGKEIEAILEKSIDKYGYQIEPNYTKNSIVLILVKQPETCLE